MSDWTYTNHGVIDYLFPGTKVKIGQYLYASPGQRYWAILIIGVFYDSDDNELWRKEVFIRKTDGRGRHNAWPQQFDEGGGPPPAFTLAGRIPGPEDDLTGISIRDYRVGDRSFDIQDGFVTETTPEIGTPSSNCTSLEQQNRQVHQPSYETDPRAGYLLPDPSSFPAPVAGIHGYWAPVFHPDTMAFFASAGHNPRWGRDSGPAPPLAAMGRAAPNQAVFGLPQQCGSPCCNIPVAGGYSLPHSPIYQNSYSFVGGARQPQPRPVVNPAMPAANMTNSTGGIGCEPGYNYFFPAEHTKIHVLKTGATPPWQFPANYTMPFHACHVPVNTTIGDLLKGFGATNSSAKLNKVFEITQGGNGTWYRGLCFSGDEKDNMKKTLKEVGWDKTRSGLPGGKPVVHLYITKD